MNTTTVHTPHELGTDKIQEVISRQRAFFRTGTTLPATFRRKSLKALKKALEENEQAFYDAIYADFKKPAVEMYAHEMGIVFGEIDLMLKHLDEWMQPKRVNASLLNFPSTDYIYSEPYGVNLIIAPWNYPMQLTFSPLVGAIGTGNTAVIKPSELTPHTSALTQKIVNEIFDPGHVQVIQGGVSTSTALLAEKWDHIFFTGSVPVGRIVMQAAAKHLTPVTLELGGKSPCIVDEKVDLDLAAKRIVWGKFINAGQTCVAPDYVLAHAKIKDELIEKMGKWVQTFYGENIQESPDYPRIVNERHFDRVSKYLSDGVVAVGGNTDKEDRYIEPTILDNISWDDRVMKDEIFGPILPILTFIDIDEAIHAINDRPKPLALYFFGNRSRIQDRVLRETSSGGACINEVVAHLANHNLPFGGVGNSGIGTYHGKYSFQAFSHQKSVSKKGTWLDVPLRYPPYKGKLGWIKKAFKVG